MHTFHLATDCAEVLSEAFFFRHPDAHAIFVSLFKALWRVYASLIEDAAGRIALQSHIA
jgi:hypothetical protein